MPEDIRRTWTQNTIYPVVGLSLALMAVPRGAAAADCGGSYIACLNGAGAMGNSDALHETDCYTRY